MFIVVTDSGIFREWKREGIPTVGDRVSFGRGTERVEVVCPGQWESVEQFWDWFLDIGQRAKAMVVAEERQQTPGRTVQFRAGLNSGRSLIAAR